MSSNADRPSKVPIILNSFLIILGIILYFWLESVLVGVFLIIYIISVIILFIGIVITISYYFYSKKHSRINNSKI